MATPGKKPLSKGVPPTVTAAPNGQANLTKPEAGALTPLNFKISPELAKEWKMYCVANDFKQVDLFKAMFEFWKEQH